MLQVELKALFGLCYARGLNKANLLDAEVNFAFDFLFLWGQICVESEYGT
jgi:hypothetical protein